MSNDEQDIGALLSGTGLRNDEDEAWKAQVLAEVDAAAPHASNARRRIRRSLTVLLPVLAAAALVLVFTRPPPPAPHPVDDGGEEPLRGFEVRRIEAAPDRRGDDLHPGDLVSIRAPIPDHGTWELRVYRDGRELVLRCPQADECESSDSVLRAELRLPATGVYHLMLVESASAVPSPAGGLDEDVAAAVAAGAKVSLRHRFEVR